MPSKIQLSEASREMECDCFSKVLLKHSMADGRDCWLTWKSDFSKRELLLHVDFLSPGLLVDFLEGLLRMDERFGAALILDLVKMSKSFSIRVIVNNEGRQVSYKLNAYRRGIPNETTGRTEIELLPLSGLSLGSCVGKNEV